MAVRLVELFQVAISFVLRKTVFVSLCMRHLLLGSLAALACLGVFSLTQASAAPQPDQQDRPNFSGTWTLDLKASTSVEPLMGQIGASLLEQKYAASNTL